MARLIYVANVSLDGYVEDADGGFDWTEPSDDVFAFITELVRPCGTYLYGRRMYETMTPWEIDPALAARSGLWADFAQVWRRADKVVYSATLPTVPTPRTRLERRFEPDSVRELKASATADMTIGGSTLAAQAFDDGLVDECRFLIYPVLIGQGKPAFAGTDHVRLDLVEEHRFGNGVVHLRYRVLS